MSQHARTDRLRRSLPVAVLLAGPFVFVASLLRVEPLPPVEAERATIRTTTSAIESAAAPAWVDDAVAVRPGGGDVPTGPSGQRRGIDLAMAEVLDLTAIDREGAYPDGRAAFAMTTICCNVGTIRIPWHAAMDPRHPFIAQNLYRIADGRFEQIGLSWLKHSYFAADDDYCGPCTDTDFDLLDLGCSDTYSFFNNSDRTWLGPRGEVDPLTGVWDPCGSHFDIGDGSDPDCLRSHSSAGHGPLDHRLRVFDSDLDGSDARYLFEGTYYVADDVDVYNNTGHREAVFRWDDGGNTWDAGTVGRYVNQPAVLGWDAQHHFATPRDEGDVIVSTNVIDRGDGRFEYVHVVTNVNLARGIGAFSIPMPEAVTITDVRFHAPLEDEEAFSSDAWRASLADRRLTWSTDPHDIDPLANTIRFGTSYTFSYIADRPPHPVRSTLEIHRPGDVASLSAPVLVPRRGRGLDGIPAALVLRVDPLVPGSEAEFDVRFAPPGERVHVLFSRGGVGRTRVDALSVELGLDAPLEWAGSAIADARGRARLRLPVPAKAPAAELAIQALTFLPDGGPLAGNVVVRTLR